MTDGNITTLTDIDWSDLPAPPNDGGANHLTGVTLPPLALPATDGSQVQLSTLSGITIIFAYPKTGRPDVPLPEGWDMIPGARGCTPQACSFRDLHQDLRKAGASQVLGLSTQTTDYQQEAVERLHLTFPLLSDADGDFRNTLNLPVMEVEGKILLRRLNAIVRDGKVEKVFYPVFPPDRSARDVLSWMESNA